MTMSLGWAGRVETIRLVRSYLVSYRNRIVSYRRIEESKTHACLLAAIWYPCPCPCPCMGIWACVRPRAPPRLRVRLRRQDLDLDLTISYLLAIGIGTGIERSNFELRAGQVDRRGGGGGSTHTDHIHTYIHCQPPFGRRCQFRISVYRSPQPSNVPSQEIDNRQPPHVQPTTNTTSSRASYISPLTSCLLPLEHRSVGRTGPPTHARTHARSAACRSRAFSASHPCIESNQRNAAQNPPPHPRKVVLVPCTTLVDVQPPVRCLGCIY
jgi:hypothetical protein